MGQFGVKKVRAFFMAGAAVAATRGPDAGAGDPHALSHGVHFSSQFLAFLSAAAPAGPRSPRFGIRIGGAEEAVSAMAVDFSNGGSVCREALCRVNLCPSRLVGGLAAVGRRRAMCCVSVPGSRWGPSPKFSGHLHGGGNISPRHGKLVHCQFSAGCQFFPAYARHDDRPFPFASTALLPHDPPYSVLDGLRCVAAPPLTLQII